MKVSLAALTFLVLTVDHGSQSRIINEGNSMFTVLEDEYKMFDQASYRPDDCCTSYTSRIIRCKNMADYFETGSGCSNPGVIFITKKRKPVCTDPRSVLVKKCMRNLGRLESS